MILDIKEGQKYGRWTVIATGLKNGGKRASLCECECGTSGVVNNASLPSGKSQSCGCLRAEVLQWREVPSKKQAKPEIKASTMSQPVEKHSGPRLIELTDTRHNANDGIGSGVRMPRGLSSMAMV